MTTRDAEHPITQGILRHWMHKHDELYHGQRGPAEQVHILVSAYSDPAPGRGGTGKREPIVWWIPYGQGKVVTNLMGHSVAPHCGEVHVEDRLLGQTHTLLDHRFRQLHQQRRGQHACSV